jgi:peptide/nickel transport system substrate-binding protein
LINEIVDNGMTRPKQIGVSDPAHPWYNEQLGTAFLDYDLAESNRLLDEIGLTARDVQGMRLNPDGEPIVFSLVTTAHHQWLPAAEIISEELHKVGLQAILRTVTWSGKLSALREARWDIWLDQELMGYPHAWPNGMEAVRPSHWNGYAWFQWLHSGGRSGTEPPPLMKQCWQRWRAAQSAATDRDLTEAIQWLQATAAAHLWAVGINSFPPQVFVTAPHIRNVPLNRRGFLLSTVYCTGE